MFFYFITFFSVNNSGGKSTKYDREWFGEFSIVINRNEEPDL